MFNFLSHPYMRWLRSRPQGSRPGFNIDQDGLPPQTLVQRTVSFPIPDSEVLPLSASPTGLASFVVEQPNEVPGFRVGLRDDVPSFNLNENDMPRREGTWPDGMETTAPESPDIAQTWTLPPGVEEPDQPAPPHLPEWLYKVVTMPVPQLSTAFDPRTGRRIVPYEPLIGPATSYLTTDQNARGTEDARPYVDGISPLLDLDSAEAPSAEQWPSSDMPAWPANINTGPGATTAQHANPEPTPEAVIGNAWPQPRMYGWPYAEARGAERQVPAVTMPQPMGASPPLSVRRVVGSNFILANAGNAGEQQAQQQKPLPQDQPGQLKVTPPNTGLAGWPPALRVPEKPGMEMTKLERRTEQEPSQFAEEYRRAAANLIDELASTMATLGSRFYHDTILKPGDDLARLAERFADDPVKTTLSVLNSFPQTRVEGEFLASFAAVFTILANAARGLAFERAVLDALNAAKYTAKVDKNTSRIGVEGLGRSVPDILREGVTEIKSGMKIDNSVQLRVQAAYAKVTGVPFNLIVSPTTERISQEVREAVRKTGGTIQRFDPATGTFTPFQ